MVVNAKTVFSPGNEDSFTCWSVFCGGGKRTLIKLCLVVLWLSSLSSDVHGKWVEGVVDTSQSKWVFLTRFCFLSTHGKLEYEIEYPVGYGTQDVLLYFDTPGQWDSIYDRGKNCSEKTEILSTKANQVISLNTSYTQTSAFSGCSLVQDNGDTWYNCASRRTFKSTRERWWYIALARCGDPKDSVTGLYARYKIHMTNGDDFLHQEYSADEFYIFPINIAFFVLYVIMTVLSGVCAVYLRKRNLFHSTYKLYMVSMVTWAMSLLLKVVALGYYGVSGWEWNHVEVSGRVVQSISQIAFILLLVLMAKGYTITRGFLSTVSIVKITFFISFYFITTCALIIWEREFFDPGKVLYYYESPPGYCMVALQLVAWCWFLYAAIFTLKHTDTKSLFYVPFFTFYTLWFWAGPIIIMVAMFAMAKWSREKTVNGVEQLVAFLGHAVFLVLTRPSAANSNFPYHVRTTQIDTVKGDKPNYHFDEKDADHYVIKSGPDLDFFITGKPKTAKNDIDNISTIGMDDNGNLDSGKHRLDNDSDEAAIDKQYPPLDPKSCWFNIMPGPPEYEEASNLSGQYNTQDTPQPDPQAKSTGNPPPLLAPAHLPAPPPPNHPLEIPLSLISPPSFRNGNQMETNLDLDPNQVPIKPRLSIISDNSPTFKKSLQPLVPANTSLKPLSENSPLSLDQNSPPNSNSTFKNINNNNNSPPSLNHNNLPPIFNNFASKNPLLRLTPPAPTRNRNNLDPRNENSSLNGQNSIPPQANFYYTAHSSPYYNIQILNYIHDKKKDSVTAPIFIYFHLCCCLIILLLYKIIKDCDGLSINCK